MIRSGKEHPEASSTLVSKKKLGIHDLVIPANPSPKQMLSQ
jgi:hypothetical protein